MKRKKVIDRGGVDPGRYMPAAEEKQLREYVRTQLKNSRAACRKSARPAMDFMIVELLLDTGLRAEELVRLKIQDTPAHHGHDQIKVRDGGKGGVLRTITVVPEISTEIKSYVKQYRKAAKPGSALLASERGYRRIKIYCRERKKGKNTKSWHKIEYSTRITYRSLWLKLKRICERSGLTINRTAHMMRHTFATKLYATDRDIYNVKTQLGHKNIQTTTIYARTESEAQKSQAARLNQRLGPRYSSDNVRETFV